MLFTFWLTQLLLAFVASFLDKQKGSLTKEKGLKSQGGYAQKDTYLEVIWINPVLREDHPDLQVQFSAALATDLL